MSNDTWAAPQRAAGCTLDVHKVVTVPRTNITAANQLHTPLGNCPVGVERKYLSRQILVADHQCAVTRENMCCMMRTVPAYRTYISRPLIHTDMRMSLQLDGCMIGCMPVYVRSHACVWSVCMELPWIDSGHPGSYSYGGRLQLHLLPTYYSIDVPRWFKNSTAC